MRKRSYDKKKVSVKATPIPHKRRAKNTLSDSQQSPRGKGVQKRECASSIESASRAQAAQIKPRPAGQAEIGGRLKSVRRSLLREGCDIWIDDTNHLHIVVVKQLELPFE